MLKLEAWMDIKDLHRQGHSIRTIAEMTGLARNTVRRVLREQIPGSAKKRGRNSQLDSFKPYLERRYTECALSAVRLLEEIKAMGYTGGIDVVRRFLHSLDPHARARQKMTVRFETPPGEQAQADWAACDHELDEAGRRRAVYAFVMVLSYSRMLYVSVHALDGCAETDSLPSAGFRVLWRLAAHHPLRQHEAGQALALGVEPALFRFPLTSRHHAEDAPRASPAHGG